MLSQFNQFPAYRDIKTVYAVGSFPLFKPFSAFRDFQVVYEVTGFPLHNFFLEISEFFTPLQAFRFLYFKVFPAFRDFKIVHAFCNLVDRFNQKKTDEISDAHSEGKVSIDLDTHKNIDK